MRYPEISDRQREILLKTLELYVSTDAGYRYYVDALMERDPRETTFFEAPEGYGNLDELLRGVSEGMSEVTRLLAVVAGPSALGDSVSRVDYLPLPGGPLLLVVSMESGASSSASVTLPAYVEYDALREIFAVLNSWLGGRPFGGDMELATAARKALSEHTPLVV